MFFFNFRTKPFSLLNKYQLSFATVIRTRVLGTFCHAPLTFRDNVSGILVSYITVLLSISAPEVNNQQIDISNVEMRIHNCKASTKFTSIEQNKSHVQVFCRIPKGLCFHQPAITTCKHRVYATKQWTMNGQWIHQNQLLPRFIQFWTETQISPQMLFQTRTHTEYHYYFPL